MQRARSTVKNKKCTTKASKATKGMKFLRELSDLCGSQASPPSEREPRTKPHLPRRLVLRRESDEHVRDRRAEVRVRYRTVELGPLVVHQHGLRIEEVEHVGEQRQ